MSAPVRIESEAWDDLRFATLARVLGLADADHALIKVARLWSWQAEHYTPDAPTYVVDADTIDSALERSGAAEAMVRAKLAESVPEGYRIRGARGRIEWLWQRRQSAKAGGEATKRKKEHKEEPGGLPVGQALGQPLAEPNVSPLVPALVIPEEDPLPRAIPPSAEHVRQPTPSPEAPKIADELELRRAAKAMLWREYGDLRQAIASELKLEIRPLPTIGDPGERALADRLVSAGPGGIPAVIADARHAMAVVAAEARRDRSVQWLTGMLFEGRSWQRALGMSVGDAKRQRAGPGQRHDPTKLRIVSAPED